MGNAGGQAPPDDADEPEDSVLIGTLSNETKQTKTRRTLGRQNAALTPDIRGASHYEVLATGEIVSTKSTKKTKTTMLVKVFGKRKAVDGLTGGSMELSAADGTSEVPAIHPMHDPSSPTYVDASKWCINREDLDFFEHEVRRYLVEDKFPNPKPGEQFHNPYHEDPEIGPLVYSVNQYYIKPVTEEAGGMSWALMRHPEGLQCDVFATHAWNEGIFEFLDKVKRAWPPSCRNIYICFLANPQNSNIEALLTGDIEMSPFAQALKTARSMIVIPNRNVSIYTRIWCVYEAHLAIELIRRGVDLDIKLPVHRIGRLFLYTCPFALLTLAGGAIGVKVLGARIGHWHMPLWWILMFNIPAIFVALIGEVLVERCVAGEDSAFSELVGTLAIAVLQLFVGVGIGGGIAMYLIYVHQHELVHLSLYEKGQGVACLQLLLCFTLWICQKIYCTISKYMLSMEMVELEFKTVMEAQASSDVDKERIFECITGIETEVDATIQLLREVGYYNRNIQRNHDRGLPLAMARDGLDSMEVLLMIVTWEFWWVTDLAGRGMVMQAWLLPLGTMLIIQAFMTCLAENLIFPADLASKFGLVFIVASKFFVSKDAVAARSMSRSTLSLQLGLGSIVVFGSVLFLSQTCTRCFKGFFNLSFSSGRSCPASASDVCHAHGRVVSRDDSQPHSPRLSTRQAAANSLLVPSRQSNTPSVP